MPERCIVAGCSSLKDVTNGITLHLIPFFDDDRPEVKRRRRKWVEFVNRKRAEWLPYHVNVFFFIENNILNRLYILAIDV